jgi:hypothetical protein
MAVMFMLAARATQMLFVVELFPGLGCSLVVGVDAGKESTLRLSMVVVCGGPILVRLLSVDREEVLSSRVELLSVGGLLWIDQSTNWLASEIASLELIL